MNAEQVLAHMRNRRFHHRMRALTIRGNDATLYQTMIDKTVAEEVIAARDVKCVQLLPGTKVYVVVMSKQKWQGLSTKKGNFR